MASWTDYTLSEILAPPLAGFLVALLMTTAQRPMGWCLTAQILTVVTLYLCLYYDHEES